MWVYSNPKIKKLTPECQAKKFKNIDYRSELIRQNCRTTFLLFGHQQTTMNGGGRTGMARMLQGSENAWKRERAMFKCNLKNTLSCYSSAASRITKEGFERFSTYVFPYAHAHTRTHRKPNVGKGKLVIIHLCGRINLKVEQQTLFSSGKFHVFVPKIFKVLYTYGIYTKACERSINKREKVLWFSCTI